HSGDTRYPDCRPSFTRSLEKVLNLSEIDGITAGMRNKLHIWSPAIDKISKSELLLMGYETLGKRIFESWSCYLGTSSDNNKNNAVNIREVDIQCGICESCMNRKRAFSKAGLEDKTHYANH
ncbi:MAG TPA: 7-cyano-7-deazaguanine synthase, partial [Candidatus Nitrosocosmicus sp.]|nr:7-cyano-7-deazaguanine synthase [Candidatus Nitrosocosmicus sp.]